MIDEVPWTDGPALREWVEHNLKHVTALILERLLGHFGFVSAGDIPSQTSVRCVLWKHENAKSDPRYARFRFHVYYEDVVSEGRVRLALALIDEVRMFKRLQVHGGRA